MGNRRKTLIYSIAVLGMIALTLGISYSFFSYSKVGTTDNTIKQGSVTFIYEEIDKQGNGISIDDAFPETDNEGKEEQAFNFKILSQPSSQVSIPYEITLRKTDDSADLDSIIKIYLTKVDSLGNETQVKLLKYSELPTVIKNGHQEKQVFVETVPATNQEYTQNYRLRMWVAEDADFGNQAYVGKDFSIKVNVYADDAGIAEAPAPDDDIRVDSVVINNNIIMDPSPSSNIDFEKTVPNSVSTASFEVYTLTEAANTDLSVVTGIVPLSSTLDNYTAQFLGNDGTRGTTTNEFPLNSGDNFFKATVTSANATKTKDYILRVIREQSADASVNNIGVSGYALTHVEGNIYSVDVPSNVATVEIQNISTTGATVTGIGTKSVDYGNNNSFNVTVTSENGLVIKDYVIKVNRALDNNSKLASLTVTGCDIAFVPTTTTYSCNVANSVESVTVTGVRDSSLASVSGNGEKTLHTGNNPIVITVTAQDQTYTEYTINVNRAYSSDNTLSSITVSTGTLTPVFDSATTAYTVTVPYNVDSITIGATANSSVGYASGDIGAHALTVGNNVFVVTGVAEDTTELDYTVTVVREPDTDTSLKSIAVTGYDIVKVDNNHYTLTVNNDVTSVEITAEANSQEAVITLSGNVAIGTLTNSIIDNRNLDVGPNNFTITVTAQSNAVENYYLTITRLPSDDATLSNLVISPGTLTPVFASSTTNYSASVDYNVTSVTLTPTTNHPEATYEISANAQNLQYGANTIVITVTAEDGTTQIPYNVVVTRNRLTASELTYSNSEATTCTDIQCAIDDLYGKLN